MSAATVLATDPDELRAAARMLRELGSEGSALAERLRRGAAHEATVVWTGLAALEQQARAEAVGRVASLVSGPAEEVAAVLERTAGVADDAAGRVRSWTRVLEDAETVGRRLRAAGPPPDPLGLAAWRDRLAEVEAEVQRAGALVREAEEDFDRLQRAAAEKVRGAWDEVSATLGHLTTLGSLGQQANGARSKVSLARIAAPGLLAFLLARRRGGAGALRGARRLAAARLERVREVRGRAGLQDRVLRWASRVPGVPRIPTKLVRRGLVVGTVVDGARSAVDGGGYDGWRGNVTRVLGGAAAVGAPASFVPFPPVALAGTVSVGAYTTWTAGNWVYDNRSRIVDAGRATWRAAQTGARHVGEGARTVRDGARVLRDDVRDLRDRAGRSLVRRGLRTAVSVDRALERLRERGPRDLVTLGGRAGELVGPVDETLGRVLRREIGISLPDLPSLPRLPVELPVPSVGLPLPSVDVPSFGLPSLPGATP